MDNIFIQYLAPGALASAVLAFVLREWGTIFDVGIKVYDRFTRDRLSAPFEVLSYESTLQLRDPQGHKAVFLRRTHLRFLQDYTIAIQDFVWGDGDPISDYKISPGIIADRYRDGERWNLLISLRQTKGRNDEETFNVERTVRNAFTGQQEWVQAETWLPFRKLCLRVQFPKSRPCKRAWVIERSRNRTTQLNIEHFHTLADGRTEVVWQRQSPRRGEIFTLKWDW